MQQLRRITKRLSVIFLCFFTIIVTSPVFAVGPTGPVGPQTEVGPNRPVGPQTLTGPRTTPGPQTSTSSASPQSSVEATNSETGPDSENTNEIDASQDTNINETNASDITNDVALDANTGTNRVQQNTEVGNVTSGDVNGSVTLVNTANSQFGEGSSIGVQNVAPVGTGGLVLNPAAQRTALTNDATGPNSRNTNDVTTSNDLTLVSQNDAFAHNGISIDANTGNNLIADNTRVGDLTTGDINLALNTVNILNAVMPNTVLALDVWNVLGDLVGDIIIPAENSQTGPGSSNVNQVVQNADTQVTVTANSDITNDMAIQTNTGGNTIEANTVVGDVSTGDTEVNGAITNITSLAQPVLYLINVFGEWVGENLLGLNGGNVIVNQVGNEATGPNSANSNTVDHNRSTTIESESNATAHNQFTINANTGNNTVRNNTEVGNISTGSINIGANVVNLLNTWSQDIGSYALRIVNIFGNWQGSTATPQSASSEQSQPSSEQTSASSSSQTVAVTPEDTTTVFREQSEQIRERVQRGFGELRQTRRVDHSVEEKIDEQRDVALTSASSDGGGTSGTDAVTVSGTRVPVSANILGLTQKFAVPLMAAGIFGAFWIMIELIARRKREL